MKRSTCTTMLPKWLCKYHFYYESEQLQSCHDFPRYPAFLKKSNYVSVKVIILDSGLCFFLFLVIFSDFYTFLSRTKQPMCSYEKIEIMIKPWFSFRSKSKYVNIMKATTLMAAGKPGETKDGLHYSRFILKAVRNFAMVLNNKNVWFLSLIIILLLF